MSKLLWNLDGMVTVPTIDQPSPYQNFQVRSYKHEFEVGEKLLKAVYCKAVEMKCEMHRLVWPYSSDQEKREAAAADLYSDYTDIQLAVRASLSEVCWITCSWWSSLLLRDEHLTS